jgi:hypothetical protein
LADSLGLLEGQSAIECKRNHDGSPPEELKPEKVDAEIDPHEKGQGDEIEDANHGIVDSESKKRTWAPRVGMVFDSLDNAESEVKKWSVTAGFELRRGHKKTGQENLGTYM